LNGIKIDITSSKTLADSLDRAIVPNNPYFNELVRILTTRCLQQAVYFSSGSVPKDEFGHYGIACDIYTHFTSPIRRYADVVVHRLLGCCIGVYPLSSKLDNQRVRSISDVINHRHRMAQAAGRSSVELHTLIYFKGKELNEDGYVTRTKANGFNVIIPRYGIEGLVFLGKEMEKTLHFNSEKNEIHSSLGWKISVFQKVRVQISIQNNKLNLLCFDPPIHKLEKEEKKRPINSPEPNKNKKIKK